MKQRNLREHIVILNVQNTLCGVVGRKMVPTYRFAVLKISIGRQVPYKIKKNLRLINLKNSQENPHFFEIFYSYKMENL